MSDDEPTLLDPWLADQFRAAARAGERPSPELIETRLQLLLAETDRELSNGRSGIRHDISRRRIRPYGAAIGVLAAVGMAFWLVVRPHDPSSVSSPREYHTGIGERLTVTLPNGTPTRVTRVTLAPQTTVRIANGIIDMSGEVYIAVPSAASAPTIVRTGSVSVRVLGTTFDVRRYPEDTRTYVAVTSGKVAVGGRRWTVVTGDQIVSATDSTAQPERGTASDAVAWTGGELTFQDVPLGDVLQTVGRWSGVHFKIPDAALAHRPITATVDIGSRAELFRALSLMLDVDVIDTHGSDTVTLQRRKTPKSAPAPNRNDSYLNAGDVGR